uniref:Uncharacterized protein n=1 Tax=Populus trichocarpa TaxID=3694 RepID=B9I7K3_POPTR
MSLNLAVKYADVIHSVILQSAISKINPELLKSVIASGFAANKTTPENGNQFSNKSFDLC